MILGFNPYAERVDEHDGRRRVLVAGQWIEEGSVEPSRVCRMASLADAGLAVDSQAVAEIAESFGFSTARAYQVWRARPGQATDLSEATLRTMQASVAPDWMAFHRGVAIARGRRGRLLHASASLASRLPWSRVIHSPDDSGFPLGVIIGLDRRLPPDAWRLDSSSPQGPPPPGAAFGKSIRLPPALAVFLRPGPCSPLCEAWLSLCIQSPGFRNGWVCPDRTTQVESGLLRLSSSECWEITDDAGRLAARVILSDPSRPSSAAVRKISLSEWAGPPPAAHPVTTQDRIDGHGRVPYRSRSRLSPSEAVAPQRLEAAMHEAMTHGASADPDQRLANLMGLTVEDLVGRLSCEQADAVTMALTCLASGNGLILADDTGFGKGRILAALAWIGRIQSRTVVWVTENAQLFSDAYRDLLAVAGPSAPLPEVLHADARILDPQGKLVVKSQPRAPAHTLPSGLILTTYAQLASDPGKDKLAWLLDRMGSTAWCILDESHNAAGDAVVFSQTMELLQAAAGVVYSSATFARSEQNLALYQRAMGLSKAQLTRLCSALTHDEGLLRQTLVEALARRGRLLRREHPPLPPPPPVWMPMTPEIQQAFAAFSGFWQALFQACEAWEETQGGRSSVAWLKLGGWLSRTVREFSMLIQVPALADWVQARLAEQSKVVIAADMTLEAALAEAIGSRSRPSLEDTSDDAAPPLPSGSGLLWRDRLRALLDEVVPTAEQSAAPADSPARQRLCHARSAALLALESLPLATLSPIDTLIDRLSGTTPVGEISARHQGLEKVAGDWTPVRRKPVNRIEQVRDFNAGTTQALVLTRAGSTGISLHSGRSFADQRKRWLMEWGIAVDPVARTQFWGRVRRRDQAVEPGYASLALDVPYERRLRAREERKRLRLASFAGQGRTQEPDEVGPEGEDIVTAWAADRPIAARRIGVHQPLAKPGDRVDRALVRAMVLPEAEQMGLIARLDRGLALRTDSARHQRTDALDRPSRSIRRMPWHGHPDRSDVFCSFSVQMVERTYAPLPCASTADVLRTLADTAPTLEEGPAALEAWKNCWQQEATDTPDRRRSVWNTVAALLPHLRKGSGLTLTSPISGLPTPAVVLGVSLPSDTLPRSGGASAFAPDQLGVHLFLAGHATAEVLPLSLLLSDPCVRAHRAPAQPAWFALPPSPLVACGLEGDPLAAAQLGHRTGQGRLLLIRDEAGTDHTIWRFPPRWDWRRLIAQPRDLLSTATVRRFMHSHPSALVHLALPWGCSAHLESAPEGWWLVNDLASEPMVQRDWLSYAVRQRLSAPHRRPSSGGSPKQHRFIRKGDLPRLLHSWESQGLGWRVDAAHASWAINA